MKSIVSVIIIIREPGKRKGTGKTQDFAHAEEKEVEKHSIFNHARESHRSPFCLMRLLSHHGFAFFLTYVFAKNSQIMFFQSVTMSLKASPQ
jgi:hypothetical protein